LDCIGTLVVARTCHYAAGHFQGRRAQIQGRIRARRWKKLLRRKTKAIPSKHLRRRRTTSSILWTACASAGVHASSGSVRPGKPRTANEHVTRRHRVCACARCRHRFARSLRTRRSSSAKSFSSRYGVRSRLAGTFTSVSSSISRSCFFMKL